MEPCRLAPESHESLSSEYELGEGMCPSGQSIVEQVEKAVHRLHKGTEQAVGLVRKGHSNTAKDTLHRASHAAKGLLDALFSDSLVSGSSNSHDSGNMQTRAETDIKKNIPMAASPPLPST
jgi:hypothetical protein